MESSEADLTMEEEGKVQGEKNVSIAGDGEFSMIEVTNESITELDEAEANSNRRSAIVVKKRNGTDENANTASSGGIV